MSYEGVTRVIDENGLLPIFNFDLGDPFDIAKLIIKLTIIVSLTFVDSFHRLKKLTKDYYKTHSVPQKADTIYIKKIDKLLSGSIIVI